MSVKKSGLGKGLGALISDEAIHKIESNITSEGELIQEIDVNLIIPNKDQPRKHFDVDKIESLGESIRNNGLIQPIVLKRKGGFYEIIAGERRWRAVRSIGQKKIAAIIKDVDAITIAQLALIENIQRENLNPIEEAMAYHKLIEEYKITQDALSKIVGKSRSHLTNTMRLLKLEDYLQEAIMNGDISHGHGRAILALSNDKQRKFAYEKILNDELSVRKAEDLVKNIDLYMKSSKTTKKSSDKSRDIISIEDELSVYFGTKVLIQDSSNRGKITIDYYNVEDLNRILDLILSK